MLIDQLKSIVGPKGWTSDSVTLEPHLTEWREGYRGSTPLLVYPSSTEQVAAIVKACRTAGSALVVQGGNTGLCGGAIPTAGGEEILMSMSRMNRIRSVSPDDFSMVAEAGCILEVLQRAAAAAGRHFPLSLAAEGSCQIGGNLSTNAGGINVLKFGTARDQVLGLEVVLADGTVWNGLRTLRKDTAGYDLKHLFIGSEGTLGVITAAALKLYPQVKSFNTALLAFDTATAAVQLLAQLRETQGDQVYAFELIPDLAMRFVLEHIPGCRAPFEKAYPWYVLVETSGSADSFASVLVDEMRSGQLRDAIIAKNDSERNDLWRLRHSISEAQKFEGRSLKHDISVPIGSIAEFLQETTDRIEAKFPDVRIVAFGHVGDGNLHFNISQPKKGSTEEFLAIAEQLTDFVYDSVASYNGSISAEHGIGRFKKEMLKKYRSSTELNLMRTVKHALDPDNLFNPGKVI